MKTTKLPLPVCKSCLLPEGKKNQFSNYAIFFFGCDQQFVLFPDYKSSPLLVRVVLVSCESVMVHLGWVLHVYAEQSVSLLDLWMTVVSCFVIAAKQIYSFQGPFEHQDLLTATPVAFGNNLVVLWQILLGLDSFLWEKGKLGELLMSILQLFAFQTANYAQMPSDTWLDFLPKTCTAFAGGKMPSSLFVYILLQKPQKLLINGFFSWKLDFYSGPSKKYAHSSCHCLNTSGFYHRIWLLHK